MIIVKINKYFNPKIKWSSPYKIMDFYKPTARFPSRKVLVGWVRHGAIGIRRHPYWINCFIGHMDVYRPLILMSVGFTAPPPRWFIPEVSQTVRLTRLHRHQSAEIWISGSTWLDILLS